MDDAKFSLKNSTSFVEMFPAREIISLDEEFNKYYSTCSSLPLNVPIGFRVIGLMKQAECLTNLALDIFRDLAQESDTICDGILNLKKQIELVQSHRSKGQRSKIAKHNVTNLKFKQSTITKSMIENTQKAPNLTNFNKLMKKVPNMNDSFDFNNHYSDPEFFLRQYCEELEKQKNELIRKKKEENKIIKLFTKKNIHKKKKAKLIDVNSDKVINADPFLSQPPPKGMTMPPPKGSIPFSPRNFKVNNKVSNLYDKTIQKETILSIQENLTFDFKSNEITCLKSKPNLEDTSFETQNQSLRQTSIQSLLPLPPPPPPPSTWSNLDQITKKNEINHSSLFLENKEISFSDQIMKTRGNLKKIDKKVEDVRKAPLFSIAEKSNDSLTIGELLQKIAEIRDNVKYSDDSESESDSSSTSSSLFR
ncbi:hypothetical protein TRFO_23354 [Tritrichomonas foetus]|uniref:Uncharacterized protein n=1 Tax=Tritrichomonas foetus TaxID=1144522 RepID=A0A1J4KAF8_9EUKA|nr:hypothetical protein TRFO_23354 [Tritrichomonas foetus]|eukprot:OHT08203.1 hypothetical protein TRFO_23354 [Tritrichomonas foetus]